MIAHLRIQRTLAVVSLLYAVVSNAQTAAPLPKSLFNFRQYLVVVNRFIAVVVSIQSQERTVLSYLSELITKTLQMLMGGHWHGNR